LFGSDIWIDDNSRKDTFLTPQMYRHYAKEGVYDNIIFSVKTQVKTFNYQSPIKLSLRKKTDKYFKTFFKNKLECLSLALIFSLV
jgi:hypothetical protein